MLESFCVDMVLCFLFEENIPWDYSYAKTCWMQIQACRISFEMGHSYSMQFAQQICLFSNLLWKLRQCQQKTCFVSIVVQTLTILYIYLIPWICVEAVFAAIFTVLTMTFLKQIWFLPKGQIFSFHLIPFASKSID